jgi:hypothetical protein
MYVPSATKHRHGYARIGPDGREHHRVLVATNDGLDDPCSVLVLVHGSRVALVLVHAGDPLPGPYSCPIRGPCFQPVCQKLMLATGLLKSKKLHVRSLLGPDQCVSGDQPDAARWAIGAGAEVTGFWEQFTIGGAADRRAGVLARIPAGGEPHYETLQQVAADSPFANPIPLVAGEAPGVEQHSPLALGFDAFGHANLAEGGVVTDAWGNAIALRAPVAGCPQRPPVCARVSARFTSRTAHGTFVSPAELKHTITVSAFGAQTVPGRFAFLDGATATPVISAAIGGHGRYAFFGGDTLLLGQAAKPPVHRVIPKRWQVYSGTYVRPDGSAVLTTSTKDGRGVVAIRVPAHGRPTRTILTKGKHCDQSEDIISEPIAHTDLHGHLAVVWFCLRSIQMSILR